MKPLSLKEYQREHVRLRYLTEDIIWHLSAKRGSVGLTSSNPSLFRLITVAHLPRYTWWFADATA